MNFYDTVLAHCLRMAKLEPAYAVKAARWYEGTTEGQLIGLEARVALEISQTIPPAPPRRPKQTATSPTSSS